MRCVMALRAVRGLVGRRGVVWRVVHCMLCGLLASQLFIFLAALKGREAVMMVVVLDCSHV